MNTGASRLRTLKTTCDTPTKHLLLDFLRLVRAKCLDSAANDEKLLLYMTLFVRELAFCFHRRTRSLCRRQTAFIRHLSHSKFHLLGVLYRLCSLSTCSPHLRYLSKRLFSALCKWVPCRPTDICERSCLQISHFFVKSMTCDSHGLTEFLSYLLYDPPPIDVSNRPSHRHRLYESSKAVSALTNNHMFGLKVCIASQTRPEWRKWREQLIEDAEFLDMWKSFVAIKSNLGISSVKESVHNSQYLLERVLFTKNNFVGNGSILYRKQLDILNEVMCYGSTLALQSDIPDDICEMANFVLKLVVEKDIFENLGLDREESFVRKSYSLLGSARTCVDSRNGEEAENEFKCFAQNVSLLILKSTAITLRQATCCSSGSDSDCSHASRGSDALEMQTVESTVLVVMSKWKNWLSARSDQEGQFVKCFMDCFLDQDDNLIEGLLCLLDIQLGLETLSSTVNEADMTFPVELFSEFAERCSWDVSIYIDYLLNNETCFLLYFLKFLKYYAKHPNTPSSSSLLAFLRDLHQSLKKLSNESLFPYDITPICRWLHRIVGKLN